MTDLLVNTVENGTAKKLFSSDYQVAAKTGTVGSKNGNSDAIIAGYTTVNTFVVWYSGKLENSVTGSTAPSALANKLLNKMYKDNKPNTFTMPDGLEELKLDKDSLYTEQTMLISDDGERFVFESVNKPKEYKQSYNYTVNCNAVKNDITVTLTEVENHIWKLYRKSKLNTQIVPMENNRYSENITEDLEFYAELYRDGKIVYTTPTVKVFFSPDNNISSDILDYWYWK